MLTGVVYGVMRYWPIPEDSMELVAHPSQPHVQHAHILLSAALTLLPLASPGVFPVQDHA